MSVKVSVSNEVLKGLDDFGNEEVPVEGTPSKKIGYLLGVPSKHKKLKEQFSMVQSENTKLNDELLEATTRIKDLKVARDNVLEDKSDPDKKLQRDLDRWMKEEDIKIKKQDIKSRQDVAGANNLTHLTIQAMKKDLVTKEDLQPIIKKALPQIEALLVRGDALVTGNEKVIEASREQGTKSPVIEGGGD